MTASAPSNASPDISPAVHGLTAGEIVRLVTGELHGDPNVRVTAVAPLARAGASEVSFLASARYADAFARSAAGVVLLSREFADTEGPATTVRIVVSRPHEAVLALLPHLYRPEPRAAGVDASARIGRGVRLGANVTVGAFAVLGDGVVLDDGAWVGEHCVVGAGVAIGANSRLFPHVTCYPGTRIGARVLVHAGVRLGSDGFGYVSGRDGHAKIPHVGRCVIGDDVEIGANSTIDRGSIDDTRIGAGTKIDNLVQIGHNVHVGRLCLIVSQAGISGSTRIGDGVVIGGQAGIGGHIAIGDRARVGAQSGVFGDVPAGESWSGYPARPHRESLRASAALFKLAGMLRGLERLLDREPPVSREAP